MGTVRELMARKGSAIFTTTTSSTVLDAIRYMNDQRIGAVVVTEGERVAGMFTERDVLRRVVAAEISPASACVKDVMTADVICCRPEMTVDEVSRIMRDERIRHLPVCAENGSLLGLISIGDVNAYRASDQEATITYLHEYIHGTAMAITDDAVPVR